MNKPLPPKVQQRLLALYRYVQAMEHGDLESITSLLRLAEQDAILDRLFLEIDLLYQAQNQMTPQADELAVIHAQIEQFSLSELERVQPQQNGSRTRIQQTAHVSPLPQERRQIAMQYQPTPLTVKPEEQGMLRSQPPRRKRSTRFIQTLAAVLLVGLLLGGFLVLFANRQPGQHQNPGVASQPTAQMQPPGTFISVAQSATINAAGTVTQTFEAYGLHSANATPIWKTILLTYNSPSEGQGSVLIQKQIAYITVANGVFALQAGTGQLLWKKILPFDALSLMELRVEGDFLIVGGQDTNGNASLYRLNEQDGSTIWRYQISDQGNTAFALSNGVVYAGKFTGTNQFNAYDLSYLIALNATNGHELWNHNHLNPLHIAVQNGIVYVQSYEKDINGGNSSISSLSAWTVEGQKLWSITGFGSGPIVINNGLLVLDTGGNLCAYHADNGHKAWCTHNPTYPSGSVTLASVSYADYEAKNNVLYTAYTEGTASFLQALDIRTGSVIWSRNVGLKFGSSSSLLLSQDTLSITTGTSISTFLLTDGHQLWHSTIKVGGDLATFIGSVYVAP